MCLCFSSSPCASSSACSSPLFWRASASSSSPPSWTSSWLRSYSSCRLGAGRLRWPFGGGLSLPPLVAGHSLLVGCPRVAAGPPSCAFAAAGQPAALGVSVCSGRGDGALLVRSLLDFILVAGIFFGEVLYLLMLLGRQWGCGILSRGLWVPFRFCRAALVGLPLSRPRWLRCGVQFPWLVLCGFLPLTSDFDKYVSCTADFLAS